VEFFCQALRIYSLIVFARIIFSWFPVSPGSTLESVYNVLCAITEPVLGPVRRAMGNTGVGGMGIDLSPMVVSLGIIFLSQLICR